MRKLTWGWADPFLPLGDISEWQHVAFLRDGLVTLLTARAEVARVDAQESAQPAVLCTFAMRVNPPNPWVSASPEANESGMAPLRSFP
jgi:hypothetical protein